MCESARRQLAAITAPLEFTLTTEVGPLQFGLPSQPLPTAQRYSEISNEDVLS